MRDPTDIHKEHVTSIGFTTLLNMKVDGVPTHIQHYDVSNFNPE